VRETKGYQPCQARWVSGTLTGHATTPQTVGNPQPIVSFEYRVARVPASSAYVSNPDVSLVLAIYLTNGGDLEKAQQSGAREPTKLYDRRADVITLDEERSCCK